jgi:hypothetical protein
MGCLLSTNSKQRKFQAQIRNALESSRMLMESQQAEIKKNRTILASMVVDYETVVQQIRKVDVSSPNYQTLLQQATLSLVKINNKRNEITTLTNTSLSQELLNDRLIGLQNAIERVPLYTDIQSVLKLANESDALDEDKKDDLLDEQQDFINRMTTIQSQSGVVDIQSQVDDAMNELKRTLQSETKYSASSSLPTTTTTTPTHTSSSSSQIKTVTHPLVADNSHAFRELNDNDGDNTDIEDNERQQYTYS